MHKPFLPNLVSSWFFVFLFVTLSAVVRDWSVPTAHSFSSVTYPSSSLVPHGFAVANSPSPTSTRRIQLTRQGQMTPRKSAAMEVDSTVLVEPTVDTATPTISAGRNMDPLAADTHKAASLLSSSTTNKNQKTKVIYGIRHARSVSNEYMRQLAWGDATFCDDLKFVDSPLSTVGMEQAVALHDQLCHDVAAAADQDHANDQPPVVPHWLSQVELVLVSPLTRCLQTFEYGCRRALDQVQQQQQASSSKDPPRILALPLARERVFTAAETGRPLSQIQAEFPNLDWSLFHSQHDDDDTTLEHPTTTTSEEWWYTGSSVDDAYREWRPHGQGQWYAVPGEPDQVFADRMQALQEWIALRPEHTILLVTHWGVLRHLSQDTVDPDNTQVCRLELPALVPQQQQQAQEQQQPAQV